MTGIFLIAYIVVAHLLAIRVLRLRRDVDQLRNQSGRMVFQIGQLRGEMHNPDDPCSHESRFGRLDGHWQCDWCGVTSTRED